MTGLITGFAGGILIGCAIVGMAHFINDIRDISRPRRTRRSS